MARVSIATREKAAAVIPPQAQGEVVSLALLAGPKQPIHLTQHDLGAHSRITLTAGQADLALFVWKGTVTAEGFELAEKSSAIIERGAALSLRAGGNGASVLVFSQGEPAQDGKCGGKVHILPGERVPRTASLGGNEGVGGALHADAACPTCSVWLHENSYAMAGKETPVHSHSEDEVIFVHSGSVRLGNRIYGPGTALAVAADTKYGFFSGPDGLGFVNFRARSPTYTSGDGRTVMDEAELWRGLLGQPEYAEPAAPRTQG
ncbi:MAG: hypothetical protein LBV50_06260 [Novosphingobium sp.]|jgi:hypothetical protein|nr:hypothetical protein [Novosphingobium sp.]